MSSTILMKMFCWIQNGRTLQKKHIFMQNKLHAEQFNLFPDAGCIQSPCVTLLDECFEVGPNLFGCKFMIPIIKIVGINPIAIAAAPCCSEVAGRCRGLHLESGLLYNLRCVKKGLRGHLVGGILSKTTYRFGGLLQAWGAHMLP